jgi:hypothetical protein
MYWTNPNLASIQRANLDGTGLETIASNVDATALALTSIVPEPGSAVGIAGLALLMLARRTARSSAAAVPPRESR